MNQLNPAYSEKDSVELKNSKDKFLDDLHKLIDLVNPYKYTINSILKFLESIEDYEYLYKLKKEKVYIENLEEGDKYFDLVLYIYNTI